MTGTLPDQLEAYSANLKEYMDGGGEAALKNAYELSREAMANGAGVLEIATLHHRAMAAVTQEDPRTEADSRRLAAETLLIESLSPFEMTHRAFRESNMALRRINEQLEAEATRIAHLLHSEASQMLVSAHLALEEVLSGLPADQRQLLSKLQGLLDQISQQLRRLSHELRPTILDDLGLMPALRFLAEGVSARSKIPVTVEGELETRHPPAIELTIYRAVQEALNNITRHSRATAAVVRMERDHGKLVCTVHDNGAGFDEAALVGGTVDGGIGLIGIRERLHALRGTLQIISIRASGTDLIITIPTEG
ncbi:MAG TPA: ATP-binding protein [Patescibacteria group bacterium]|jgi:signal transduction histidine kinase|nr:ATP-binding protein [Patescibacteria group bacterium]